MTGDSAESLFDIARNCWRVAHASRASFLIDADAYYRAFREAAQAARQEIFILGWDTDTRTPLPGTIASELGAFLSSLTTARPELRVYILSWDFAFIYLLEREAMPSVKFSTLGSPQIRFVLDQHHPALASHHQKIVVVDGRLAFVGGLDLTQRRWDTREHRVHDERRMDPSGNPYGPFHDVQMCVDGKVAAALREIAIQRWGLATSEQISLLTPSEDGQRQSIDSTLWPPSAPVDAHDVMVAISRTVPGGYAGTGQAIQEVEKLFLDIIARAEHFVYIENQYFTSSTLADAIASRLSEPDGPEFVMVLPRDQTGWIEESTMGLLRSEALQTVRAADRFGRFRCFYPTLPGLKEGYLKVHSKVMIMDDKLVRVGSANMNGRSMGLDTECDLAFEAAARPEVKSAIARFRSELLGEHLGVPAERFEERFRNRRSLVATVDSFIGGARTLVPMDSHTPEWVKAIAPPKDWIDPSRPRGIRRWFAAKIERHRHLFGAVLIVAVVLGLLAIHAIESRRGLPESFARLQAPGDLFVELWHWSRQWDAQRIAARVVEFQRSGWAVPIVLLGFVVGSFLLVPISAMILGVALAFPALHAILISTTGSMLSAGSMYFLGRYWAWTKSRFLDQSWVKVIAGKLSRGGIWAMTAIRLAPIAPFAVVSIVAGGLRARVDHYLVGTFLGLIPGIAVLSLLSNQVVSGRDPFKWTAAIVGLLTLSFAFSMLPKLFRLIRSSRQVRSER